MLLIAVTDMDGRAMQVNGSNIAWYGPQPTGRGSVIGFAAAGADGFLTLRVAEAPDQITTQINAKLRK